MSALEFIELCKKYVWVLILMPIVLVGLVLTFNTVLMPPKYVAKNQLLIALQNETNSQSFDGIRSSIQLVGTFSSVVQSNKTMNEVAKRLGRKEMKEKIEISTNENSLIMNIKVSGRDKDETIRVVNTIGEVVSEDFPRLFQGMEVTILEQADDASTPSILFLLIMAAIVGELGAIAFMIIMSRMNLRVVQNEQIEKLGVLVLGDIPLLNLKADF